MGPLVLCPCPHGRARLSGPAPPGQPPKASGKKRSPWVPVHADRAWQITTGDRRGSSSCSTPAPTGTTRPRQQVLPQPRKLQNCLPSWGEVELGPTSLMSMAPVGSTSATTTPPSARASLAEWDANDNGMLDLQDLIIKCSDGVDDDGNGYVDDISGWTSSPTTTTLTMTTGSATVTAKHWSVAEGNNGKGTLRLPRLHCAHASRRR